MNPVVPDAGEFRMKPSCHFRTAPAFPGTSALVYLILFLAMLHFSGGLIGAQTFASEEPVLQQIWDEGRDRSQLYRMGHELIDGIGPRITGTPGLDAAHRWLEDEYRSLGIEVEHQRYGSWEGWSSGLVHLDLLTPRRVSLGGRALAWSPGTEGPVEGRVINLPRAASPVEFLAWLSGGGVEGAFVLISFPQPTCRPDSYWEAFGTQESIGAMRQDRDARQLDWTERIRASGMSVAGLTRSLENAGAAGILTTNWTGGWGTNRVFDTAALRSPAVDLGCEEYGLLARLVESGEEPTIRLNVEAELTGTVPTFNTVAMIRGSERPDEYVVLSAHLDTWGGAGGATDNGSGTITMIEAMRILKTVYPNPRRTILVGHWGGEEQGLNGSGAFALDNPEVVRGTQILMNQDNGTGRIADIGMQGFIEAGAFFQRWLARTPSELGAAINLDIPGLPDEGRSDHASFVCHGVPAFRLGSAEWDYREYTWHTTRDTFDKLSMEEVTGNAILTAMLAYLAAEEEELIPREVRTTAPDGAPLSWPNCRTPRREM